MQFTPTPNHAFTFAFLPGKEPVQLARSHPPGTKSWYIASEVRVIDYKGTHIIKVVGFDNPIKVSNNDYHIVNSICVGVQCHEVSFRYVDPIEIVFKGMHRLCADTLPRKRGDYPR